MRILVAGAGLSGSATARLLKDTNYNVNICEKENFVGGLCKSDISNNDVIYELFGARTFHTKSKTVKNFVSRFVELNSYQHNKENFFRDQLYHYSINYETVKKWRCQKNSYRIKKSSYKIGFHEF